MKIVWKKLCAVALLASFISFNSMPAVFANEQNAANAPFKITVQANTEHLPSYRKTVLDTVRITADKATIAKGNVIKIAFAENFSTKTAKQGDKVTFVLKKDLKTKEGRVLMPEGTKFIATVQEVTPSKVWNRNATAVLSLGEIILPDGTQGTIEAQVNAKNNLLKRSGWAASGKAALWTVGLFGIGAGIGAAIGAAASAVGIGCLAIGMPVGGGMGLIIGSATKGLNYNAKPGKTIYIELTQDLDIFY